MKTSKDGIGMNPVPVFLKLMLLSMDGLGIFDNEIAYPLSADATIVNGDQYTVQRWLIIDQGKFQKTVFYDKYTDANAVKNALGIFSKMAPCIPIKHYVVVLSDPNKPQGPDNMPIAAWVCFNYFGKDIIINLNTYCMSVKVDLMYSNDDTERGDAVNELKQAMADTSVGLTTTAKLLSQASLLSKQGKLTASTNDLLLQAGDDFVANITALRDEGGYFPMLSSDFSTSVNGLGIFGVDDLIIIVAIVAFAAYETAQMITDKVINLKEIKSNNELSQLSINRAMQADADLASGKINQSQHDAITAESKTTYDTAQARNKQILDNEASSGLNIKTIAMYAGAGLLALFAINKAVK